MGTAKEARSEHIRELVFRGYRIIYMIRQHDIQIFGAWERAHCADVFLLTCAMHDTELFADYHQALRWLMRRTFAGPPIEALQTSISTATDMAPSTPQNR